MANFTDRLKETFKALSPARIGEYIQETQVYRSVFRVGVPDSDRKRMLVMLGNVFLHLHPVKVRKSGIRMRYTWCMGGITFFLFLSLTFTGLLLMFYYRPTLEYAYVDIRDLREQVPLGIMREIHRWGAHAMVIAVWLHMYRVFMTGSYKPPREFNWNVGVILLVLTLLLSFTGYLLPWDQLAIWAITVGSNMARATPVLGHEGPGSQLLALGDVKVVHAGSDARFPLIGRRSFWRPKVGLVVGALAAIFVALSTFDPNFRLIVAKPDNIPIVAMLFLVGFFFFVSMSQGYANDERIARGEPPMEATPKEA